jgi:hypothetical protein
MPLTESNVVINQYLTGLLETNKVALTLSDVYYGDQQKIPRTPTACVEPGEKRRELNGMPRRTEVIFENYILIYYNKVGTFEENRVADDLLAEAIETLVHTDAEMGGLTIDSMVTRIESGFQLKSNTLFRAARLTVEARSQVQLPSSV